MTIYSQHPHRGKVQVLATYRGPVGVVSTTVTSVDSPALASPIVDALNRISACATVPVSVHDLRGGRFRYYPAEHLGALTDRNARSGLLVGAHSLWYEYVKALLHDGLIRLDRAVESVPAPVRKAIEAELLVEERDLRAALAGYNGDVKGGGGDCREWRFESPFVSSGDIAELADEGRADLDRVERGVTHERVGDGVVDLRLLLEACRLSANPGAKLDAGYFAITDDPGGATPDGFYLSVEAPMPNGDFDRNCWRVEVCR
ncbi:hypothetical protein GCM10010492_66240 [Saccharothrix mutabilis subsp. mutabilis]|uniref:Uncharacterized protein n=1 Tax=Saccharothrix mutabilis subsp. mutabilis TaxID=66855 RepID=A0ABN0UN54_9PSEU